MSRNMYKGKWTKPKGSRIEDEWWGWLGWGRGVGGEMETTILEQQ